MKLSLHGLGCPKTGGKVVLGQFISCLRGKYDVKVWLPTEASDLDCDGVTVCLVATRWAQSLLRVFREFALGAAELPAHSNITINLSNYGFSMGSKEWLLIHSPEILTKGFASASIGNRIKLILLHWTLSHAQGVLLQSSHMLRALEAFCVANHVRQPPVYFIRPVFGIKVSNWPYLGNPTGDLQLFYPSSAFPHKRIDLCEELRFLPGGLDGCHVSVTSTTAMGIGFSGLGSISHKAVLERFAESDALLFTSEAETLGLPLLEALSHGLPAVLPDLPYAREIYGEAACYFKDFTVDSIATAISKLRSRYPDFHGLALERRAQLMAKQSSGYDDFFMAIDQCAGVLV